MNTLVLLLGANLGNEIELFKKAEFLLSQTIGECIQKSSIYISSPWGFEHENMFYNQLLILTTKKQAIEILEKCLEIELYLGRIRTKSKEYEARVIDIDILYYNNEIIHTKQMQIPHSQIQNRRFALVPLCEIIPEFIHPVYHKSNKKLLEECLDNGDVKKVEYE